MEKYTNKLSFLGLSLFLLTLFACEKDENLTVVNLGEAPAVTASADDLVLTEEDAANEAVRFTWTEADFGYDAAVSYILEADTAGDGWKQQPFEVFSGNSQEIVFTVEELSSLFTKMGYEPDVAHEVSFRVRATVGENVESLVSAPIGLTVTPYSTFIEPAFIYVPGAYQGWDPGTAPSLISVEDNGVYQGVVSFVEADNLEFKFTDERSWDLNWGAGETEGTLETNGPNLTVPTADNYMLEVDLNNLTWSAELHSWGLIGSATAGGWDTDQNLIFDSEEGVWKLTTDLTADEVKFRFNDDWGLNYGDDDPSDSSLNQNGANIAIPEAGTYEVILDLSDEENPTYSITKV